MKKLQEIVQIVSKKRVKNVEMLDKSTREDSLIFKLYEGIQSGAYLSDADAAKALFGNTPHDDRYRKLKSYLRKRVINNLFYLDINDPYYSSYHKAYFTCSKNATLINILGTHGARNAAVDLAKRTMKQARKYTFFDVFLTCARLLKDQYAFTGKKKQFVEMTGQIDMAQRVMAAEIKVENYFQDLIINYARSISTKNELIPIARGYVKEATSIAKRYFSFTTMYNLHRLRVLSQVIAAKFNSAMKECDKWEEFEASHKHFKQNRTTGWFLMYKLYCYMHLEQYESASRTVKQCEKLFAKGTNNYMIFREYHFLLSMYVAEYKVARKIKEEVVSTPKFKYFPEERQEKWRIFDAYLNFVDPKQDEVFNLPKFLNEVPIYEKDKRGYNIAIIIIHILFLLKQGKADQIYDRVDALNAYCSRWLNKDDNFRSNAFIKMLLIMTKEEFNYERVKKLSEKYYAKLASTRFNYQGTLTDMEVIPYEKLWKTVLRELKVAQKQMVA